MAAKNDTLFRLLATLRLIPAQPRRIDTMTLRAKLEEQGFKAEVRTLQRDLRMLEAHFPILCDEQERPHRWSFLASSNITLPGMDANKALTLVLAEQYLAYLLPKVVTDSLAAQFREAKQFVEQSSTNALAHWSRRVRAIAHGQSLMPATIEPAVWEVITEGLLRQEALQVAYLPRNREAPETYVIHPQALVHRHSVTYLLATVKEYDDIRQFALHRFQAVAPSTEDYRLKIDFDVDTYIASGGFGYKASDESVALEAWISAELYTRLLETPLNAQQTLTPPNESGWGYVCAVVNDELGTQWWLQSLGSAVRVVSPTHWRDALHEQAKELLAWYEENR